MNATARKSIGSVQRAIDILNLFGSQVGELGITEIAEARGLHKSTAAGLVYTLERNGYLEQNPVSRKYRLGLKLVERAFTVLDQIDVRELALPYLEELRDWCDESVNLAILSGGHVVYVEQLPSSQMLGMRAKLGRRAPVHCTALGKAILAYLPRPEVEAIVARCGLPRVSGRTITDERRFFGELGETRRRGFAIDDEENHLGGRCVGAPILDHGARPVAALSISAPVTRLPVAELPRFGQKVKDTARAISCRLGYTAKTDSPPRRQGR